MKYVRSVPFLKSKKESCLISCWVILSFLRIVISPSNSFWLFTLASFLYFHSYIQPYLNHCICFISRISLLSYHASSIKKCLYLRPYYWRRGEAGISDSEILFSFSLLSSFTCWGTYGAIRLCTFPAQYYYLCMCIWKSKLFYYLSKKGHLSLQTLIINTL